MQSDELIREVDEELQREKLLGIWKRFGNLILILAGLLVLAVAGWGGWQNWQARQRAAEATAYAAAEARFAASDVAAAARAYDSLAADADSGFEALARLRGAQAKLALNQRPEAVAALDALAGDNAADPILRDLAALLSVSLQLDTGPIDELRARLVPLAAAGEPFRAEATELQALLAVRAGEVARAREILGALAEDAEAPTNLRSRVQELRDALDQVAAGS